jgi:hypothetical protein
MEIRDVGHDDARLAAFVELPYELHGADPTWIPPLRASVRRKASGDDPFFRHGRQRSFLAFEGGAVAGRCTASVDQGLVCKGEPAGAIGAFEARSWHAAEALLDAGRDWLRGEGLRRVVGPMDLSIWNAYRFMTRGFDTVPFHGEPRNPPSYPDYFARWGFEPLARWSSWDLTRSDLEQLRELADELVAPTPGFRFRRFDPSRFDEEIRRVHQVFMEGFASNVGFSPIPEDEFAEVNGALRVTIVPELTVLAETEDGECIAFGYAYPDVADVMRRMRGELDMTALAQAAHGRSTGRVVLFAWVVNPAYRMKGVATVIGQQLVHAVLDRGVNRAIGALAKEGPEPYTVIGEPSREYVLYERAI